MFFSAAVIEVKSPERGQNFVCRQSEDLKRKARCPNKQLLLLQLFIWAAAPKNRNYILTDYAYAPE